MGKESGIGHFEVVILQDILMAFYSALLTFCLNSFTGGKRKVKNRDEISEVINIDRNEFCRRRWNSLSIGKQEHKMTKNRHIGNLKLLGISRRKEVAI